MTIAEYYAKNPMYKRDHYTNISPCIGCSKCGEIKDLVNSKRECEDCEDCV